MPYLLFLKKSGKILNCRLLQIIGGALRVKFLSFGIITYASKPLINANADVSSRTRGQNFGMSLYPHSYFV